jgi:RNA polymerase-binding transcription factor DksA
MLDLEAIRRQLERERDTAVGELRELGVSPELQQGAVRGNGPAVVDLGDAAQVSEGEDVSLLTRERVAARINRLAAALRAIADGTYGTCERCGRPIEAARLAALPEAATCKRCQEELERTAPANTSI